MPGRSESLSTAPPRRDSVAIVAAVSVIGSQPPRSPTPVNTVETSGAPSTSGAEERTPDPLPPKPTVPGEPGWPGRIGAPGRLDTTGSGGAGGGITDGGGAAGPAAEGRNTA